MTLSPNTCASHVQLWLSNGFITSENMELFSQQRPAGHPRTSWLAAVFETQPYNRPTGLQPPRRRLFPWSLRWKTTKKSEATQTSVGYDKTSTTSKMKYSSSRTDWEASSYWMKLVGGALESIFMCSSVFLWILKPAAQQQMCLLTDAERFLHKAATEIAADNILKVSLIKPNIQEEVSRCCLHLLPVPVWAVR